MNLLPYSSHRRYLATIAQEFLLKVKDNLEQCRQSLDTILGRGSFLSFTFAVVDRKTLADLRQSLKDLLSEGLAGMITEVTHAVTQCSAACAWI